MIMVVTTGDSFVANLVSSASLQLLRQSLGLLGRMISPSQGRYLHTGQQKRKQISMP
jgi:hypothetical protein